MKYKIEAIEGSGFYKLLYKKWYWIKWKDSGMSGTNKEHLLHMAINLNIGG